MTARGLVCGIHRALGVGSASQPCRSIWNTLQMLQVFWLDASPVPSSLALGSIRGVLPFYMHVHSSPPRHYVLAIVRFC